MSLIYVIKTKDDCHIKSPATSKIVRIEDCDFDKKHNIKKGCKRPNVSFLENFAFRYILLRTKSSPGSGRRYNDPQLSAIHMHKTWQKTFLEEIHTCSMVSS